MDMGTLGAALEVEFVRTLIAVAWEVAVVVRFDCGNKLGKCQ
jgi:hypothetical protein